MFISWISSSGSVSIVLMLTITRILQPHPVSSDDTGFKEKSIDQVMV
jgi:hypothetical protein